MFDSVEVACGEVHPICLVTGAVLELPMIGFVAALVGT